MIIGESEKKFWVILWVFVCFLGVAFWNFIRLFYTWVSLICLYSSYGHFGGTISCCWESVVYNVLFLLGFILSFNFFFFVVSYKHCMQIVRRNLVLGVLEDLNCKPLG